MIKVVKTIGLILCVISPVVAIAHHGTAAHFDRSVEIKIEGIVTDFQLVNPHSYVYFDGLNEDGELEAWRCGMGNNLHHRTSVEMLLPGDRVLVTGYPARRENNVCVIELIAHENGRTIAFNGSSDEGASTYKPSETLAGLTASGDAPDIESQTLAVSNSAVAQRKIVDVPTESFFGHWTAEEAGFLGVAGLGIGRKAEASTIESDLPLPTTFIQPKYTESGQALLEAFDMRFDYPSLQCKSSVIDGIFHHRNINEFVQESDTSIRWVYGYMDLIRTIHLDKTEHPEDLQPSLMGHSYGYWEDDSLVVETASFSKQWLYQSREQQHGGHVISSEQFTFRERISHDQKNDQLVVEYWAKDPEYWQEPFSGVYRLSRSDQAYQEYKCIELGGYNNLRDDGKTIFDD